MQKIVYSTCSIHAIENEGVVKHVLTSEECELGNFRLAPQNEVLPSWSRRGLPEELDSLGNLFFSPLSKNKNHSSQMMLAPSSDAYQVKTQQMGSSFLVSLKGVKGELEKGSSLIITFHCFAIRSTKILRRDLSIQPKPKFSLNFIQQGVHKKSADNEVNNRQWMNSASVRKVSSGKGFCDNEPEGYTIKVVE